MTRGVISWFPQQQRIEYLHSVADFGTERAIPKEIRKEEEAQTVLCHRKTAIEMAKFLSQDQINEFKECFSLYDKKRRGKIEAKDLITVMRCLGTSPTFSEVDRHLQVHKIDKNGELDFSTFLTMMHRQIQQEDPKAEILEAMRMTDKQKKGYILASELRAKLTGLGEKLTDKEVDELFREANVGSDGRVHYEDFTRMVTLPPVDY